LLRGAKNRAGEQGLLRMIDMDSAVQGLSALAHAGRLGVFRLLVTVGPEGMAAGDIAKAMDSLPNTLSNNLNILSVAGLVRSRREGRSIIYTADYDRMQGLLAYLIEDCCGGDPSICAPLADAMSKVGLLRAHCGGASMSQPFNALFLCTGNSARSILAEAILNKIGVGRFQTYSAGSHPKGAVNPHALKLLASLGYPTTDLRSKSWDEFSGPDAPKLDFVFTVCDDAAGAVCPIWPGQPMTAHWGLPDPAAVHGSDAEIMLAFAKAYRMLSNRIGLFAALPLSSLTKRSLQARLNEIGQTREAQLPA
jgi:arsenate reductase